MAYAIYCTARPKIGDRSLRGCCFPACWFPSSPVFQSRLSSCSCLSPRALRLPYRHVWLALMVMALLGDHRQYRRRHSGSADFRRDAGMSTKWYLLFPGWYCSVCHLLLCLPLVHPPKHNKNAGPRGGCSGAQQSRQGEHPRARKIKYDHELILRALGGKENIE